ncbi:2-dehydro-3-deoxygalactonokinase [Phytopseudomonas daroniae]|uniref:2-dehydro-3-deoxygalactonokinase n=1 Tax=Phytopseudomonas daroniae TaxID=2487519 RepID=UPI0010385007|nr:2-dehydro-3-deoxygalactonokinase [Pseudomonas daroniae]TBU71561.1 2-keto-3-deoxy-galactonokinase [Pseudomonas daroniae]
MTDRLTPTLIALDWGTSSLRAYLLGEAGRVLATQSRPWGIQHTPDGDFARAYEELVGDWYRQWPGLPALACGMIGSRQGWHEVPYALCPANVSDLVEGLLALDTACGTLHMVPGVLDASALPNVIRGEETQVFGALQLAPELRDNALLVLPGTHSKWVTVRDGAIDHFTTHMTGELFAVLRDHSILGRPAREQGSERSDEAFFRGLDAARQSAAEGVSGRLFSTRSLLLTERLTAGESLDYLSGLLIGEELRSVLASIKEDECPPLVLIGDAHLCERYRLALTRFGVASVRTLENAGVAGLWYLACAAALVIATPTPVSRSALHV